jgi:hypothetical protein
MRLSPSRSVLGMATLVIMAGLSPLAAQQQPSAASSAMSEPRPNFHSLTRKAHLDQRLSFLGTTPFGDGREVWKGHRAENRDIALISSVQQREMLPFAVKASIPRSSRSRPKARQRGRDF